MKQIETYQVHNILISSMIPIEHLLELEIHHKMHTHGTLWIRVMIQEEQQKDFLKNSYNGEKIEVYHQIKSDDSTLFCGKIERVIIEKQHNVLFANIYGITYSKELDEKKHCRSFQDVGLTYRDVVSEVTREAKSRYLCNRKWDQTIERPFIQYEETNWDFLIRIASYINSTVYASIVTNRADVHLGRHEEKRRTLLPHTISNYGFSELYYINGGYERRESRHKYCTLTVKHDEAWKIGDYVEFLDNKFIVYERKMIFEKSELRFIDTLGTEGILHQKIKYHENMAGVLLHGTIKKVEKESVYIQFDFDTEEKADYAWPWVPEVGNLCYVMPEIGSKVALSLPSGDEKDRIAVHLLRTNADSQVFHNQSYREMSTIKDKHLRLYPESIELEGKNGSSTLSLSERREIRLHSVDSIRLQAKGPVSIHANKIKLDSPKNITLLAGQSNIEICKNFDFYAQNGVHTQEIGREKKGQREQDTNPNTEKEEKNYQQLTYAAMGAIPAMDLSQLNDESIIDFMALGSVPKMAKGSTVMSMKEVMEGKRVEETSVPQAFLSMGNFTVKGGYPLPKK